MKKRYIAFILIGVSLVLLVAAAALYQSLEPGKTSHCQAIIGESEIYSKEEIEKAMRAVKRQFITFNGCELLTVEYDEEKNIRFGGNENEMVLFSSFYIYADGEGCFPVGETYSGWSWTLKRTNKNSPWKAVDWGYA